jgi:hypothetical protein
MTAAGNVESAHVFKARALQIGLAQDVLDQFDAKNLCSFGKFAWSCSYTPGASDETPFVEMVKRTLAREPLDHELSILRRLFFESHAVSLQDMRTRIDRSSDAGSIKILPAEKAARYDDQVARLVGLNLTGPLEPSHQLIDAVFTLVEENVLKYIPIHSLTCREQELMGEKEDTHLKEYIIRMSSGSLSAKEKPSELRADLGTDLKIRFALQRRALAFDQASLISWAVHDEWISVLFHRMQESAPVGHQSVTMDQCLRADRKLFLKMAETCRANINPIPGSLRPLDAAMRRFMDHSDVLYLIMPLPMAAAAYHAASSSSIPEYREGPYTGKGNKGKGKTKAKGKNMSKGKAKGKGKKGKQSAGPPAGCLSKTQDGRFICYGFNRPGGCEHTSTEIGRSCTRGYHICGREGCHGDHAAFDCPNHLHQ